MKEIKIGEVTHYFNKIGVAAIKIISEQLKKGDTIHIKGHTTDFTQKIDSMQVEHQPVEVANAGDEIGIKVDNVVREGDEVFKVIEQEN
ncbi:hypothetical protein J7K25_07205 [bacterium]|nr:hypothetical protein [bacterium]